MSAYLFLTRPNLTGALEFTPHIIGLETGAVGVLDVAASDIDGDGDIEIFTAGKDGIKAYNRIDTGGYEVKIIDGVDAERLQIVDLNKDGVSDILATLKISPSVKWYRNNGGLEFSGTFIGTGNEGKAFAADLDGDTANDVVTATKEAELIVLRRWMNNGSGTFASTTLSSDSGVTAIAIADVDGNERPNIVTGGSKGLQRWDTQDGVIWSRVDIDEANQNKTHVVIRDVNGDGSNDIVTADQTVNTVALYIHRQHGFFDRVAVSKTTDATTVQIIDLDEDGDEDVVAAGQDDNSVYWFSNNGSEEFTRTSLASNLQSVFSARVVDVDSDNDFDIIAGDHFRGNVWWYERVRSKPTATVPTNFSQSIDGSARVSFETSISDEDRESTRVRIQYSLDGVAWHKPWIISATADNGSIDLTNSNGYQVGSSNAIDTNEHDSVKLTFTWDTKSVRNTGGPIKGDITSVQVRVIPRDAASIGQEVQSALFRVDNASPFGLTGLAVSQIDETQATLTWRTPSDGSAFTYEISYGTVHADVLERNASLWDSSNDAALSNVGTTSTVITGLIDKSNYTFKLFATDSFGNVAAASSVQGVTALPFPSPSVAPSVTPLPSALPSVVASPSPSPAASVVPSPELSPSPGPTPSQVPIFSPSPPVSSSPSPAVRKNVPPLADAGIDQVVNPSALVVLDGSASFDEDGDALSYSWKQLSGPSVDLVSVRTDAPSFSAGNEGEAYVFVLTVRDGRGASATDTITIATRTLPVVTQKPVIVEEQQTVAEDVSKIPSFVNRLLRPIDGALFVASFISTMVSLVSQLVFSVRERRGKSPAGSTIRISTPRGRVVHYRTGEPLSGVQVMTYGEDEKLRDTQRTNDKGEFSTIFPKGKYKINVRAEGFTYAPAASIAVSPQHGIIYAGGTLTVYEEGKALDIVIPMKPIGREINPFNKRVLHVWQVIQRIGRLASWPLFILGALLNTFLVFWAPQGLYLLIEVLYVALVIVKVAAEVKVRPAYGVVQDAITHIPLDLAVVRLIDQKTNRLIMTRVTNTQGKFFALPPAGLYTITVTKPGYATFTKDNVSITSQQDSVLQITAELMPVAPSGGLARARSAIL